MKPHRAAYRPLHKAFTLLELLVAAALSAILAILAVQLTTSLLAGWNRAFDQACLRQQAELTMDLLLRDLEGCRPTKTGGPALFYQEGPAGDYYACQLTFPIIERGIPSLCRYWLETSPAAVRQRPLWCRAVSSGAESFLFLRDRGDKEFPPDALFPQEARSVVTDCLVRARVRLYFQESSAWRESKELPQAFAPKTLPHQLVLECSFLNEKGWRRWLETRTGDVRQSFDEILAAEGITLIREVRFPTVESF